jgi:signal transduction histidine kinase/ActR/RegA family two-component response regulator
MKKNAIETSLVAGFAAVLVLLLLAGAQMYRSLQEYRDTLRSVEHTHLVLRALNAETSIMRELESGQRAYIITRDEAFLPEYTVNKREVLSLLNRIGQLTADNPGQQGRFATLSHLAEERLQLLDKNLTVFHSLGFDAVRELIRSGESRHSMEAVLKQTNAMEEVELTLLKQRSVQAENNAVQSLRSGAVIELFAMAGLILLWWMVKRETRKRLAAEEAVHESEHMKQIFDLLQEKNVELESTKTEAEKANQAKSEFLSSMSHELRSPLNAILGFAQLMDSDSPPPTSAQKESIAQILQAGWHLLTLINEILDLAKVESRQTPLSNEPVSLAEVISECQGMIEQQAQQRGIRMVFPCFDKPCFVMADRTRVKQVLINLLSNAIKYNVKQGMVEVKCTENTPGRVLVSVSDSGAGLLPEQLEQLFQAFNRLGQEAGTEEGTGIGLVVAKRLVELMGGIIGVDSTVGVGSVFWFELDSVDEPQLFIDDSEVTVKTSTQTTPGTRQRTLLYVEDNPANLKLVEQIIARYPDIRLLTALNGISGIDMANAIVPDIILMDINLPGISGIEAMKILQAGPVTQHIPIIALSANAMPADVEKGLKAGFFRYITKPIKVDEFMEAVGVAFDFAARQSDSNRS